MDGSEKQVPTPGTHDGLPEIPYPVELPPKDGRQAWLVSIGGFTGAMCTFGATTAFGVGTDHKFLCVGLTPTGLSSVLWLDTATR
jgi:hypothetical protein